MAYFKYLQCHRMGSMHGGISGEGVGYARKLPQIVESNAIPRIYIEFYTPWLY